MIMELFNGYMVFFTGVYLNYEETTFIHHIYFNIDHSSLH
jgi:hypothetical protein